MVGSLSRRRLLRGSAAVVALAMTPVVALERAHAQAGLALRALQAATGAPAAVPPRALAVIPERHVGRLVRVVDELVAVDGTFDATATALGLSARTAIALRTREAGLPFYVVKNEATIATALQLRLGANIELTGLVMEHEGRFVFVASGARAATASRGL